MDCTVILIENASPSSRRSIKRICRSLAESHNLEIEVKGSSSFHRVAVVVEADQHFLIPDEIKKYTRKAEVCLVENGTDKECYDLAKLFLKGKSWMDLDPPKDKRRAEKVFKDDVLSMEFYVKNLLPADSQKWKVAVVPSQYQEIFEILMQNEIPVLINGDRMVPIRVTRDYTGYRGGRVLRTQVTFEWPSEQGMQN